MYANNRNRLEIYPLYKFFDSLKEFLQQILNDLNKYGYNIWDKIYIFGNPLFFDITRFPLVIDFLQMVGYTITTTTSTTSAETAGILSKHLTKNVDTFEALLTDAMSDIIACQSCMITNAIEEGEFIDSYKATNINDNKSHHLFGYGTEFDTILAQLEAEYDNERTIRQHSNYDSYAMVQSPKLNFAKICQKMRSIVQEILSAATQLATTNNKQTCVKLEKTTAIALLLTLFQFKNAVKFFNKLGMILTTTTATTAAASTATATIAFELPADLDSKLYTTVIKTLDLYIKRNMFSISSTYIHYPHSIEMRTAYFDVIDSFLTGFRFKFSKAGTNTLAQHLHNYYKCLHTSNLLSKLTSMLEDVYKTLMITEQEIGVINVSDYQSILSNVDVIRFLENVNFVIARDRSCLEYNVKVNKIAALKKVIIFGKQMDRYYFCLAYLAMIESDGNHSINNCKPTLPRLDDLRTRELLNDIFKMVVVFDSIGVNGNQVICDLFLWMYKIFPTKLHGESNILLIPFASKMNGKYTCWILVMEKIIEFLVQNRFDIEYEKQDWFKYLITRGQYTSSPPTCAEEGGQCPRGLISEFLLLSIRAKNESVKDDNNDDNDDDNNGIWKIYLADQVQQQGNKEKENFANFPNFRYKIECQGACIAYTARTDGIVSDATFYQLCQSIAKGNDLHFVLEVLDELLSICLAFGVEIGNNIDHFIKDNVNVSKDINLMIDIIETKSELNNDNDNSNQDYIYKIDKIQYRIIDGFYGECVENLFVFLGKLNFDIMYKGVVPYPESVVGFANNSLHVCNQLPRHETIWNAYDAIIRTQSVINQINPNDYYNCNSFQLYMFYNKVF